MLYTVGEFYHGLVQQIISFLADDVNQTEAKFQFGNEFEVGEVYVASHAYFEITIKGFGF